MSETAGAESVIPPSGNDPGTQPGTGDNPAWTEFLSGVPASMHDMFKPHLAKWDQGVSARIQQVHQEYEPYKAFRDGGITPEVLQQAHVIYQAVERDPKAVWEALGNTFGYSNAPTPTTPQIPGQGLPNSPVEPTAEYNLGGQSQQFQLESDPRFQRLEAMANTMANMLVSQHQAAEASKADADLDRELASAKEKFGDYPDEYEKMILGLMSSGMSADQAVQQFHGMRNQILTQNNRPAAPTVISGAGPLPSNAIDPTKLNKTDTVSLVAQMVKAANQQR